MLRTSQAAHNDAIQRMVDELLCEDAEFVQHRRSLYRTPLTRPALVFVPHESEPRSACTRNISPSGLSLLLSRPLPEGETMKVQIHTLRKNHPIVLSELRWCVPFGRDWYMSGWKFVKLAQDTSTS